MTVHIMATPDDGEVLEHDERLCDDTDKGQFVVYHAGVVQASTGEHICMVCGECSGPPGIPN